MTDLHIAAKRLLKAWGSDELIHDDMEALRQALANEAIEQPAQQEPVAEITAEDMGRPFNAIQINTHFYKEIPPVGTKLYTRPQAREPQEPVECMCGICKLSKPEPLTNMQRQVIRLRWQGRNWSLGDIIDAVEELHGIREKK